MLYLIRILPSAYQNTILIINPTAKKSVPIHTTDISYNGIKSLIQKSIEEHTWESAHYTPGSIIHLIEKTFFKYVYDDDILHKMSNRKDVKDYIKNKHPDLLI